jgi:divalent metal cation (Fe/Co/Zn/Cd) transporter
VTAVLFGLIAVRFGFALGDIFAAPLVACLILVAAGRLIKRSVDVLMDRAVSAAERDVLSADEGLPDDDVAGFGRYVVVHGGRGRFTVERSTSRRH